MSLGLADWLKAEAHPSPVAWPSPGMTGRASVVSHWFKACWLILDTQSKLVTYRRSCLGKPAKIMFMSGKATQIDKA
ncbi:hypothetical protein HYE68_005961 [Fusarium pseudograminearum]|nr:hypothetical protein HYE68_005961 [Fusarium pseudograminearum]